MARGSTLARAGRAQAPVSLETPAGVRTGARRAWPAPRLAAALAGVLNLLSALLPAEADRLHALDELVPKKFAPAWQPRYLAVQTAEDLATVTLACLRAEGLLAPTAWSDRSR